MAEIISELAKAVCPPKVGLVCVESGVVKSCAMKGSCICAHGIAGASALFAGVLGPLAASCSPGWENVSPARREIPPAKVVWRAASDGVRVERIDGAEGTVSVTNGEVRIRKTGSRGYIVVSWPSFGWPKGKLIRFFAEVEARTSRPEDTYGMLSPWSGERHVPADDRWGRYEGYLSGGVHMRKLINSAPGTPYWKYRNFEPSSDTTTPMIVIGGAPSESVWRQIGAEDGVASAKLWNDRFRRLSKPDHSSEMQDADAFARALAADTDHSAEIRTVNGVSVFFVDGKPAPPIVYKASEWSAQDGSRYGGKALQDLGGVRIGIADLRLGDLGFDGFRGPWDARGFDAKAAAKTIERQMRIGEKSLFMLAINTSAYPAFTEREHPDEVWVRKDGSVALGNSGSITPDTYNDGGDVDPGDRRWPWVSYASPSWRAAIKRVTAELFAELRRQGLMKRVIGVHYCGYHDGQFASPILDYSPAAKAEHARYVRERGLRPGDPAGSFEFFSRQLGFRALEDFSREAKRLAGKPIVAAMWDMTPFGISFDVTSFTYSDAVDVIAPQAMYQRRMPTLSQGINVPTASFHRHGKMLWMEFDFRTWAALDQWVRDLVVYKGLNTADDLVCWQTLLRKHAGMLNAARMGWWMYDMSGGWYSPREIAEDFRQVVDVRRALDAVAPDPWHPDVALVIDEVEMAGLKTAGKLDFRLRWEDYGASGVPYETYLAADFDSDPALAGRHRLVVRDGFRRLDADGLHALAEKAGAFVACAPGVLEVDMNGDFMSVHCLVPGTHPVRLPFAARATNVKDGSRAVGTRLDLAMTAGETRWFRIERLKGGEGK